MSSENLNQTNLEGGNLAVHEDTCQVELHLETNVDICAVDSRTPPKSKPTVRDLVQTRALSIGELLVSHGFLETRGLLPEETLPCGEVCALEQSMLEYPLDATQGSNDVDTVVIELP